MDDMRSSLALIAMTAATLYFGTPLAYGAVAEHGFSWPASSPVVDTIAVGSVEGSPIDPMRGPRNINDVQATISVPGGGPELAGSLVAFGLLCRILRHRRAI